MFFKVIKDMIRIDMSLSKATLTKNKATATLEEATCPKYLKEKDKGHLGRSDLPRVLAPHHPTPLFGVRVVLLETPQGP